MGKRFELQASFETSAPSDPKWPWAPQGQRYLIYVLQVFMSLKFKSVLCYDQRLPSYRPFFDKCTQWPQMTLNTTRSKVPHTCVTSLPGTQLSVHFPLRQAFFELQATLRQVHQMTPKDPGHYKVKGTPYMWYHCPWIIKFQSVSLYDQPFWVTGQFETISPNDSKMTLCSTRSKVIC